MSISCRLAAVMLLVLVTLHDQVRAGTIIGGHKAQEHSRPYMVLLQGHPRKFCGGVLLNEDFVLTAAHCQAKSYQVLLGFQSSHNKKGVQRVSVAQEFPHKEYDNSTHINDIMLLKLSSKAEINGNVKAIPLADRDQGALLPNSCSVAGWGSTEHHKSMSPFLMEASVKLVNNEFCAERNVYCSTGVAGPGQGDSGGPLVCEGGRVYGVVSLSHKEDEDAQTFYMYTKVASNRAWIDEILQSGKKMERM